MAVVVVRDGAVVTALLVVVLALALALSSCGTTATAAELQFLSRKPKPPGGRISSTPGDPNKIRPGDSKFTVVTNRYHKRDYQITCTTDWGASCFIRCPAKCPNKCLAYCAYCLTFCLCDFMPGTSCGDPRFTGADGNTFYFHGKKDESFCVLSDDRLHVNARFMGNHNADSGRDFTWVQALGVTFFAGANDDAHRLYVGARRAAAAEWDEDEDHVVVVLDGEPVDVEPAKSARWVSSSVPGLTVTRTAGADANALTVELDGVFAISANAVPITDEESRVHSYGKARGDSLVHLDVAYKFHGLTKHVHGVLGQTYRPDYVNALDISAKMPVMGGADKYRSSGLFATDCAVSRFHHAGGGFTSFAS